MPAIYGKPADATARTRGSLRSSITELRREHRTPVRPTREVGRTNSNPEVVTRAHASGLPGWPSDALAACPAPRASDLRARRGASAGSGTRCARPPPRLPRNATGRRQALAAHPADPAQRALGDLALVEAPRSAHAARTGRSPPRTSGRRQAGRSRGAPSSVQPPVSRATGRPLVVAAPPARRPRASRGSSRRSGSREPVRQRQLHDRAQRLAVLLVQRPGRVGDVVLARTAPAP